MLGTVFWDLKQAFDTVNPVVLLHKLQKLKCSQQALHWFSSYLKNREQCVKVHFLFFLIMTDVMYVTCLNRSVFPGCVWNLCYGVQRSQTPWTLTNQCCNAVVRPNCLLVWWVDFNASEENVLFGFCTLRGSFTPQQIRNVVAFLHQVFNSL